VNTILTLIKKELRDVFASPIAYVFITVFLVLSFWLYFSGVFFVGEASMRIFFGWLPVIFIVFLPTITMGKWAEEKNLGVLAIKTKQIIQSISKIKDNYNKFEESLVEFSKNFVPNGAENTAKIAAKILEEKK